MRAHSSLERGIDDCRAKGRRSKSRGWFTAFRIYPNAVKRLRERKIFMTIGRDRGSRFFFFYNPDCNKKPSSEEDRSVQSILEKEKSTVRSFEQQQVEQRYKWLWKSVRRSVRATSINFYSSLLPFLILTAFTDFFHRTVVLFHDN